MVATETKAAALSSAIGRPSEAPLIGSGAAGCVDHSYSSYEVPPPQPSPARGEGGDGGRPMVTLPLTGREATAAGQ